MRLLSDRFNKCLMVCSLVLLHGCDTLGPGLTGKRFIEDPVASKAGSFEAPQTAIVDPEIQQRDQTVSSAELYKGSGVFVKSVSSNDAAERPPGEGIYTLNFSSVDLAEVVKVILADTLKRNFVISPKVSGQVSLQTTRPLSEQELLPTLQMLLRMNNAVLIDEDSLYRIQPLETALLSGVPLAGNRALSEGFQVRVIPLRYIGVQDMQKILQPVLPKQTLLQVDQTRNLLFVAGSPAELLNARNLVELFDVDIMRGMSVGLYPLVYVDAKTLEKELGEIFGAESGHPLGGMLRMLPVERMNALMVMSPQPEYLSRVEQWVKRLDRSGPRGQAGQVHVYKVQNVDAVELAAVLEQIFPEQAGKVVGTDAVSLAPGLKPAVIQSKDAKALPAESVKSSVASTRLSGETQGQIRIIPDEMNNTLVIVASSQDYQTLIQVIEQLDVTPLQVLVDATIIEVSLTDELHYGLQWFFTNKSGRYSGSGSVGDSNFSAAGAGGFSYSLVNSSDLLRAELNALASDSKVNVVSAPSLMVLNNQEATIKVGDQVPIRTSESANTNAGAGDSAIVTSTIQMRDTGVTLNVKPRVNAGGLVIMEIEQNVDGVSRTESSEIDSPTIQQRQIKSSVAVQSGETIVLGGLITEQREQGKSGVPVLSRLPVIGGLFGKTDKVLDRTELVVLLTPRVVTNQTDARQVTSEFKNKLTGIYTELREQEDASPSP